MSENVEQRAVRLLEQEDQRSRDIAARRAAQEKDGRLKDAIERVKQQDAEARVAQSKKEAEARAADLSHKRYELEERIEAEAMQLRRSLGELESLHARHLATMREAGRSVDSSFHGSTLTDLITERFRQWFGGWNSLTGTPAPLHVIEDLPLPERDGLATPGRKEAG